MRILGISAFYHDSAAVLVEDGYIIAAAREERFTRKSRTPVTLRTPFAAVSTRAA
jgi:carbamoyltransferase